MASINNTLGHRFSVILESRKEGQGREKYMGRKDFNITYLLLKSTGYM